MIMMAKLERMYNIPLRKEFQKAPKYRRAKKAVNAVKSFLKKHMKVDDEDKIRIGKYLNDEIWKHGIKNPPHHVKVNVIKDDDGKVTAELVGAPVEKVKEKKKAKEKTTEKEKKPEKKEEKAEKKEEKKKEVPEKKPEEKAEEKKEEVKTETKELKKEPASEKKKEEPPKEEKKQETGQKEKPE